MKIVGLLGGIASGKSAVAQLLADHGARVLNADRLGHEVLEEAVVREALRQHWGAAAFAADGSVDRRRIAGWVFAAPPAGPLELAFLEQLTHPRIGQRIEMELRAWRDAREVRVAVLDAALLLKAGWDRWCDEIIYVDAPLETRIERAKTRGWSEREFAARESAQTPCEEKRRRATRVLTNAGTLDDLRRQVEEFWRQLNKST